MSVLIENEGGILVGGRAILLDDARECAWAEKYVRHDPDLKWVLGNYVEADNANDNGHIFPLDDLKASQATIFNKPLNMLHQYRRIVGNFAGAELLYPMEQDAKASTKPYVEALAAFYRYYFPEEYKAIEEAHAEGSLFYSMEAVPKTLTCAEPGCDLEFAYRGRIHDSYCAHLQEPVARRKLNRPHFKGGAIIIPPVSPGWSGADIKELSELMAQPAAEAVYEACKEAAPHLSSQEWESVMFQFLAGAVDLELLGESAETLECFRPKVTVIEGLEPEIVEEPEASEVSEVVVAEVVAPSAPETSDVLDKFLELQAQTFRMMAGLAAREAPVIHVAPAPAPHVNFNPGDIHVDVHTPEISMAPPAVNVEVHGKAKRTIHRDDDGNITSIEEE